MEKCGTREEILCFFVIAETLTVHEIRRAVPPFDAVSGLPYPVAGGDERVGALPGRDILVEAIVQDRLCILHIAPASHVPFAEVSRRIAAVLQGTCHGGGTVGEEVVLLVLGVVYPFLQEGVDAPAGGVHACGEPYS